MSKNFRKFSKIRMPENSCCSSLSDLQTGLEFASNGPTEILPFLYLGSQEDALNHQELKRRKISHVLNVSLDCPKADHLESDEYFLRIPVNDNHDEKLLPYFMQVFLFLEKVRERGAVVLIHCLAGISRSPTFTISYIMRFKKMGFEEAHKFVKSKRHSINPNFNFLGQLLKYEQILGDDGVLPQKTELARDLDKYAFATTVSKGGLAIDSPFSLLTPFSTGPSNVETCLSSDDQANVSKVDITNRPDHNSIP